jgi:biopolymer transport protein ExbD
MKIPSLSVAFIFILSACSSLPQSERDPRTVLTSDQSTAAETNVQFPLLTIMITREGDYYVKKTYLENGTEKETILKSQGREPEALQQTITQVTGQNSGMPVQIAADKDSRFQSYVSLLDVLRKLDFVNVTIKTQKGEPLRQN